MRTAQLHDQLHLADVDAELERRGGHQRAQLPALETPLGIEPLLLRETAVMRRDVLLTDALAQVTRDALDHAPRIGKHERRAVRVDQLCEAVVEVLPDVRSEEHTS